MSNKCIGKCVKIFFWNKDKAVPTLTDEDEFFYSIIGINIKHRTIDGTKYIDNFMSLFFDTI